MYALTRTFFAAAVVVATTPGSALQYNVKDLGTLGGTYSSAYSVNDLGYVVGTAQSSSGNHAFLFSTGPMIDLGTFGGANSTAYCINNSSQVVGGAGNALNQTRAFLYDGGSLSELGTMGELTSVASSINDSGQIVGYAGTYRAFIFDAGTMTDLGNLGFGSTVASGISNGGFIAGSSAVSGATHAFRSPGSGLNDLGTLGGKNSYGRAVNSLGQVVGESDLATGSYRHAYLYSGGTISDLGAVGNRASYALSINDSGEIVGYAGVFGGADHGFIRTGGVNYDLNYMLDGPSSVWEIWYARDINERGQIAAEAHHISGWTHAVLLTPTDLIAGVVNLQSLLGSTAGRVATFWLYRADGTLFESWTSPLAAGGRFYRHLASPVGAGTWHLRVKCEHWLAASVPVTFSTATLVNAILPNGDCDGNNYVGTDDYLILNRAFDTSVGGAGFDPRADLNGDGYVGTDDYLILNENFDMSGD